MRARRDETDGRAPPRPSLFPGDGDGGGRRGSSFLDDVISSLLAVAAIGLLLFAISGVWPPLVAIESPSMEPHIDTGDLVFVMEEHRFAPDYAVGDTGVVTKAVGARHGYSHFKEPGDVIVYKPGGSDQRTPVIHRAVLWVNDSENWYDKANASLLGGAENCRQLAYCPAPHGGFLTLGDNRYTNPEYDQIGGQRAVSPPVRPSWVIGTAEFRLPGLGWLRLGAAGKPVGNVDAAATAVPA